MHPDFYANPVQVIEHGDPRRDGWVTPLRVFLVDDEGRVDKYDRAGTCVATCGFRSNKEHAIVLWFQQRRTR